MPMTSHYALASLRLIGSSFSGRSAVRAHYYLLRCRSGVRRNSAQGQIEVESHRRRFVRDARLPGGRTFVSWSQCVGIGRGHHYLPLANSPLRRGPSACTSLSRVGLLLVGSHRIRRNKTLLTIRDATLEVTDNNFAVFDGEDIRRRA